MTNIFRVESDPSCTPLVADKCSYTLIRYGHKHRVHGVFTKLSNAEKAVEKLKSMGIDASITREVVQ